MRFAHTHEHSLRLVVCVFLLMVVQALLSATAMAATEGNVVVNGGFESELSDWKTWTPKGEPELTVDTSVFHSGKASARITGFTPTDRGALVQRPSVEGGKTYAIRVWIKTEDVSSAHAYVRIQFNQADNGKSRPHLFIGKIEGTQDWTLYEDVVEVPEGTVALSVEPFLDKAQGIMWIDDIEVAPINVNAAVLEINDVQATTLPSGSVRLAWNIPVQFKDSSITYKVYKSVVPDFNISRYAPVGITESVNFIDRNTRSGQTLYYRVALVNANGESGDVSPTVKATVDKSSPAAAPRTFTAEALSSGSALLGWDLEKSRARQIRLERSTDGGESWLLLALLPPWMVQYKDESLAPGVQLQAVRYRLTVISPEREETPPVQAKFSRIIPTIPRSVEVGEHPALFVSAAEIAELNKKAASDISFRLLLQTEIVNPAKMAAAYSKVGISLPEKGDNNAHLTLARQARQAALGYAFTGNETMAEAARAYLLAYAENYKEYPLKIAYDGRVNTQTLNESPWLVELAWTYDLIWNSDVLTAEDRQKIENDLLREAVRVIDRYDKHMSNWQAWHNAAIGSVAFLLNDEKWIQEILTGSQGFTKHMANAVRNDGMWWEQSIGYHNLTLRAMSFLAEMAYRQGYDLYHYEVDGKTLKLMYDAPIYHAFSDGNHPIIGNAKPTFTLTFSWVYGLAAKRYGDQRYAVIWRETENDRANEFPSVLYLQDVKALQKESITLGTGDFAPSGINVAGSSLFADTGMAVLRGANGDEPGLEVAFVYKPHGTAIGHQAADNLSIILEGPNGKWLPGPGSFDYGRKEQGTWYKQTVARNGVVVDRVSQYPQETRTSNFASDGWSGASAGSLEHFVALPSAALVAGKTGNVYKGVTMERTVLVSGPYVIDRYALESEESHQYDWVAHIAADEKSFSLEEEPVEKALGSQSGFQHIVDIRAAESDQTWDASWERGPDKLRLTMLGAGTTAVMRATGFGPGLGKQPMLIASRKTENTEFVTVMEEYTDTPALKSIRKDLAGTVQDLVLERTGKNGQTMTDHFAWHQSADGKEELISLANGAQFKGEMAFFRQGEDGQTGSMLVAGGTAVAAEGLSLTTDSTASSAVERVGESSLAVTQYSDGVRSVKLVLPDQQDPAWLLFRLEDEATLVAEEVKQEATDGQTVLTWDAKPGAVYMVSTEKPGEAVVQHFVVTYRL